MRRLTENTEGSGNSGKMLIAWTGKAITVTKLVDADLVAARPPRAGCVELDQETYLKVVQMQWRREQEQPPQEGRLV